MNRLCYVLEEINDNGMYEIVGVVSQQTTAHKFYVLNPMIRRWTEKWLDNPELLNRIAKEGEKK